MRAAAIAVTLAALVVAGCGSTAKEAAPPKRAAATHKRVSKLPDPKEVGANELGMIPVIMHHRVANDPASEYDMTPAQFRRELRTLYRRGYRPIAASDMVTGRIQVPPGKTPVVLTFDDSSREQFALLPNGKVDPETAVGILLAFARNHSGFTPSATFFVISTLFDADDSDGPRLLAELARLGFDIGDHTYHHANLGALDATAVQREIILGKRMINDAVPEKEVRIFALPYGVYPKPHELALHGSWDGDSYDYGGVFEVGSGPAPSPYSINFDPLAIPRIRAAPWQGEEDFGSGYWLHYLQIHRNRRYVSDGDPTKISFPAVFAGAVAPEYRSRANPY